MKSTILHLSTLFFLLGIFLSCKKEFEMSLPLATNQDLVELKSDAGETNVMVYSTGDWTATLEKDVNWAELEENTGHKTGAFKFKYTENTGGARTISVVLKSGSHTKTVKFIQATTLTPQLAFVSDEAEIVGKAYPVGLPLSTNLESSSDLENIVVNITYSEESEEEWIKDYRVTSEGLFFNVLDNTSSGDRRAQIQLVYTDAYGIETMAQCILKQTNGVPTLALEENSGEYMLDEDSYKLPYQTNMSYSTPALKADVVYTNGTDWAQDISFDLEGLSFKLTKNESGMIRVAILRIKAIALDGTETQLATYQVTQTVNSYNVLSFETLRGLILGSTGEYTITDPYTVLSGVVISDKANLNMALNPLVSNSQTAIDWTETQKTVYLQSPDAQYGLRLKTVAVADNVFERTQEVRLSLENTVLVKESNPERYTLRNVTAGNVMSVTPGVIQPKQKALGSLVDKDIYTYVTLTNVEMAVKNGAYTNVHDGYTWGGIGTPNIAGSSGSRGVDCAPRSVVNSNGETLNILFNMRLPWRRLQGNGVPKGAGNVSGILVHEKLIRYAVGGDIGRYQIRPLAESDIALGRDESTGLTNTLVEWNWDDNTNTKQAQWTPDIANGNNSGAILKHETITTVERRPDFNSPFVYFKNGTTSGTNNPTGQTSDIEGYIVYGAIEYRGVYWNYTANKGNGFVVDFSTSGIGSRAHLSFTIAGGGQAAGATNYFPTSWHVEYAVNGGSYQKINGSDFTVRPIGWWTTLPVYSVMGLSEQHVVLPSDVANQSNVSVKIVPSSSIGLTGTDGFNENYGNVSASASTYVRLGTVSIKYNK